MFEFLCFFGEDSQTFLVYEKNKSRNQPGLFHGMVARFILRCSTGWCLVIYFRFWSRPSILGEIVEYRKNIRQTDPSVGPNCRMLENIRQTDPHSMQNSRMQAKYPTNSPHLGTPALYLRKQESLPLTKPHFVLARGIAGKVLEHFSEVAL